MAMVREAKQKIYKYDKSCRFSEKNDLIAYLQEEEAAKKDYICPARDLSVLPDGKTLVMGNNEFRMIDLFHLQLASALKIPMQYYNAMRFEKPDLLAKNVNSWLSTIDKNYMLRTVAGKARALLSDSYCRIDNLEVVSAVLSAMSDVEEQDIECNLDFQFARMNDEKLYLRFVSGRERICASDRLAVGFVVSNSETGRGAVSIRTVLYTFSCSNGMLIGSDYFRERKTHVGNASQTFNENWEITTITDNRAFTSKLKDMILCAIDEERFGRIVDKLAESAKTHITGCVNDVIKAVGKEYELRVYEQEKIFNYLLRGRDLSLYGLSNAVTRYSQDVEDHLRATELEEIGWYIATMETQKWEKINADCAVKVRMLEGERD